ncbi:methionine ABC transporter permease [Mangrovicoccus algicola]|uniref:ABC transporter permease subunit n=1 Tax=Mangrovicoccus algicola TaxID=2771008 RepID=A0A8J6Z1G9_9RHOB|nr:ABC transporter permease subunit [Mangrovicoccus algicola]MBE3639938.1 ABC transporter permease subunit [Mangrovicoccus algicola]
MAEGFAGIWTRFGAEIAKGFAETFYMVGVAFAVALVLGTAIGMVLSLCARGRPFEAPRAAALLSWGVTVIRSVPFILFLIVMAPVARALIGTAYGMHASTISLSLVGIALVARLVEQAIADLDPQIYRTAQSMGAGPFQIILRFVLVEARGALILGYTSAIISLIAYSTVVGVIAGGGIGYLAVQEGFYMWNQPLMWVIILLMTLLVQIVQVAGSTLARRLDRKGGPRQS